MVAKSIKVGDWIRIDGRPGKIVALLGKWIMVDIQYQRVLVRQDDCYQF